jgi:hypothetical protein
MPFFSDSKTERAIMTNFFFEPTFDQINERPFKDRDMTVVEAVFDVYNDFPDREILAIHGVSLEVQHGTKHTGTWDRGGEVGGELGLVHKVTYKAKIGIPFLEKWEGERGLEQNGKFIGKYITKIIDTSEDSKTKTVSPPTLLFLFLFPLLLALLTDHSPVRRSRHGSRHRQASRSGEVPIHDLEQ